MGHECHHGDSCNTSCAHELNQEHCEKCCHHHHDSEDSCDFSKQLLGLADEAWTEVLKEKIKKKIEESNGKKLDQLAQIVSDANNARWHAKLAKKKGCSDFHEKIRNFFEH